MQTIKNNNDTTIYKAP